MSIINRILIQKIYIGLLARPADPSGIEYWSSSANKTNDINLIARIMYEQDECKSLYLNCHNYDSKLDKLYFNLFGRTILESELNYWKKNNLKPIPDILCELINDRFKLNFSDSDQIFKDFDCLENKVNAAEMFTKEIKSSSSWVNLYQPKSYNPWCSGEPYEKASEFLGSIKYGQKPTEEAVRRAVLLMNSDSREILQTPIIEMNNVSLRIPVFSSNTRAITKHFLGSVTGGRFLSRNNQLQIEALNDLTLTFMHGERIALIGHNGSGKSSFLRLISGIYMPTAGELKIHVNVYPMLQKSFLTSDELTGIDAAKAHYLMVNKNLIGFETFLDDIIEFSGLGNYLALPIKSYSEGMSARLIFSILTGTNHDCLAIDEGFGTGDAEFFEKAEKRMKGFVESSGTLFLASHSDELLKTFCQRGILFKHGKVIYDGPLETALNYYHNNELYKKDI